MRSMDPRRVPDGPPRLEHRTRLIPHAAPQPTGAAFAFSLQNQREPARRGRCQAPTDSLLGSRVALALVMPLDPLLPVAIGGHDAIREGVGPPLEAVGIAARAVLDNRLLRACAGTERKSEGGCSKNPHAAQNRRMAVANLGPQSGTDKEDHIGPRGPVSTRDLAPCRTGGRNTDFDATFVESCCSAITGIICWSAPISGECGRLAFSECRSRSGFLDEPSGWKSAA